MVSEGSWESYVWSWILFYVIHLYAAAETDERASGCQQESQRLEVPA